MDGPDQTFRADLIELLPRLRRFALTLCRNGDRADDLLQSACERALARHHQFERGTRMDSWMFTIVHSIWKNDIRREVTRRGIEDRMPDPVTFVDGERDVVGKIFLSKVLSLVEALPEHQSSALMLVNVEGLSYAQAAEILDVPVGTVMSRIARARQALGKELDKTSNVTPLRNIGR